MRAFIAVDIPEDARKEIRKIQKELPEFRGKLTEKENLHLTLKFLGEIDESKAGEVKKILKEVKEKRFKAEVDEIGFFSEEVIRIVWLHLSGCENLQKKIDEKLKNLFSKEKRFMSHLTIARVKSVKDKKEFLKKLGKIKIGKIAFEVSEFKLKKSTLTAEKPVYEDLMEVGLI